MCSGGFWRVVKVTNGCSNKWFHIEQKCWMLVYVQYNSCKCMCKANWYTFLLIPFQVVSTALLICNCVNKFSYWIAKSKSFSKVFANKIQFELNFDEKIFQLLGLFNGLRANIKRNRPSFLLTHNSYLHCKIMQNYFCLGFLSLTIIVHNDTIIDHNDTIKNHNDMVIDNNDSKIERGITSLNLYRIFVIVKSSTHLFTKKTSFTSIKPSVSLDM